MGGTGNDRKQLTDIDIYKTIIEDKKIKESKPGDFSEMDTKNNTDNYGQKIGALEKENDLLKSVIVACLVAFVVCIVSIVVDICRDNGLLRTFNTKEIEIYNKLNKCESSLIELKGKQSGINDYINQKVEAEVNKAMLEFYKSQGVLKK